MNDKENYPIQLRVNELPRGFKLLGQDLVSGHHGDLWRIIGEDNGRVILGKLIPGLNDHFTTPSDGAQ